MKAGNVREFVNNLAIQDEMVRYNGKLYYFYGIRYDTEKKVYYTSIDRFGENLNCFEKEIYRYGGKSISDCLEHLVSDMYWNGQNFYQVESEMTWVDG